MHPEAGAFLNSGIISKIMIVNGYEGLRMLQKYDKI